MRANRTIHIEVSLLGCDAQRKARRGRACLQFLPTVCRTLTTILAVSRFDLAHVRCTVRPIGLIFLAPPSVAVALISKPRRPGLASIGLPKLHLQGSDRLVRWRGSLVVAPSSHTLLNSLTMLRAHGGARRNLCDRGVSSVINSVSWLNVPMFSGSCCHLRW